MLDAVNKAQLDELRSVIIDALYGGYPLVHNSKLLPKGVGYYYDQFDAFDGAKVLLDVIDNHDKQHAEYVTNIWNRNHHIIR